MKFHKGQLKRIETPVGTVYWYSKLGNRYLVVFPKIFRKDPYDFQFAVITERKFASLIKDASYVQPQSP